MRKEILNIHFILIILSFCNCKSSNENIIKYDFSEKRSFNQYIEDNVESKNYIVTVLSNPDCDLCDYLKGKLPNYTGIPPNVIFRSVNLNNIENSWFKQLFREASSPLIIITNPNNDLVGYVKGARLNIIKEAFQEVFNKGVYFNDADELFLHEFKIDENIVSVKVEFMNNLLQVYLNFSKEESLSVKDLIKLRSNVERYPYFFNVYLLYLATNDKVLLNKLLAEYNTNYDQFLYGSIKESLFLLSAPNSYNHNRPQLELDNPILDFGVGTLGNVDTTYVKVKNIGDTDLVITDMVTSCNCISVYLDEKIIKPREQKNIKILYEMLNTGVYLQQILLFSNAIDKPSIFTIKGVVTIR